jgi:hypothetical protein
MRNNRSTRLSGGEYAGSRGQRTWIRALPFAAMRAGRTRALGGEDVRIETQTRDKLKKTAAQQ